MIRRRALKARAAALVQVAALIAPATLVAQEDADVIRTAYPLPLRFAPGEKWEYCNVGYFALAEIIRKVSGKPWSEYIGEQFFLPLEMTSTRTTTLTEIVPSRADGYVWRNGKLRNAESYLALRPSGAFLSTVLDLAKWDAALYSDRILKPATREQIWTPVRLNSGASHPYGFGWELDAVGGHRRVRHGGSLPGFRAEFARYVDDKLSIVVLTNADSANPGAIALGVAERYLPGLIPKRTVARVDPKLFDALVGQYRPNPTVLLTISREGEKLMLQQSGSPEKQELLPESETAFFTLANRLLTYTFARDEKGQVTHLVIQNGGREVARAGKIR